MSDKNLYANSEKFFIDGQWCDATDRPRLAVVNPATEQAIANISLGDASDVDRAVTAARKAFPAWRDAPVEQRASVVAKAMEIYMGRLQEIGATISQEMGAPLKFAIERQAGSALLHMKIAVKLLKEFKFSEDHGRYTLLKQPIGVCGLITPWNWPANQIMCKLAPALATGCTVVLKPSEMAPLNAVLITEVFAEAGLPAGVLNLVNGDGPGVGSALSKHPGIDMISFTGSTRAGIAVAESAAATVKRVTQELGGKSANIILDDADFKKAVAQGVFGCMGNSGQTCLAPTRMLVPADRHDEAVEIAIATAAKIRTGLPNDESSVIGPLAHKAQYDKVVSLINQAIEQGSKVAVGGPGKPEGIEKGYFVAPTIFSGVNNDDMIAREEVFGPVLCIIPYQNEDEAIAIANDTPYGLAGYVQSGDPEHAKRVASQIEAGYILANGAELDFHAPLAGHKQSGNGAEWGEAGFDDYLLVKSVVGC